MTEKENKNTKKCSPLPWEFVRTDSRDVYAILDVNGVYIAEHILLLPGDFQLIVRAVNSHEANEAKLEVARELVDIIMSAWHKQTSIWEAEGNRFTDIEPHRVELARKFQEIDREES